MISKLISNRFTTQLLSADLEVDLGTLSLSSQPCSAPRSSPYTTKKVVLPFLPPFYLVATSKTIFFKTIFDETLRLKVSSTDKQTDKPLATLIRKRVRAQIKNQMKTDKLPHKYKESEEITMTICQ